MANVVELRGMSDDKLEEMLENAREEMFNLRFQQAAARLKDYARLRQVRREIAQLETVLNMRRLAVETAVAETEQLADLLQDKEWKAVARFNYEESAWLVEFTDDAGNDLATALVDLNKARPKGRKAYQTKKAPSLVKSYEIVG